MAKLTDTQLIILSNAAAGADGVAVVPATMNKATAAKGGASLVARKLMRELRADIDVKMALRQPLHVIGKTLPGPGNPGAQHRLRDILDAFHQLDQPLMIGRAAWRETDAAIAHDGGGDAILR